MKCINILLLLFVFMGIGFASAQEAEWKHTKPGENTTGQVQLKDASGNIVNVDNSQGYIGLNSSLSPLILNIEAGGGSYDWAYSIELSDGTIASFEKNLNSWVILNRSDFDAAFDYDVIPAPLMDTQSGQFRDSTYITADILMITRNSSSHQNRYSCTGTSVGSITSQGSSIKTKWTEWDSGSACRAWHGIYDGDSAVAWAEPKASISYSLPYGWISGADNSGRYVYTSAPDGSDAVLNGTFSASVALNWLQAYLSYNGQDRMFAYRYTNKTGSNNTSSLIFQSLNEDGTLGSIVTGDLSGSRWNDSTPAILSAYNNPIYVLDGSSYLFTTDTGGKEYLIVKENEMSFAFKSDGSVVNFIDNIQMKSQP